MNHTNTALLLYTVSKTKISKTQIIEQNLVIFSLPFSRFTAACTSFNIFCLVQNQTGKGGYGISRGIEEIASRISGD